MSLALQILGAFYILGGVAVLRQMAMSRLLDQVLYTVTLGKEKEEGAELMQTRILSAMGFLLFATGVSLATLSAWAPLLFAAGWVCQAAYLPWAARAVPPQTPLEAKGRRQTRNAFFLYTVALIAVGWGWRAGVFSPWPYMTDWTGSAPLALAVELALPFAAAFAVWAMLTKGIPGRKKGFALDDDPPDFSADIGCGPDNYGAVPSGRLRLAPEYQCWPLWDDETGRNVDPHRLPLSGPLVDRLMQWDDAYQATYNGDDPVASGFADEHADFAWRSQGGEIAAELRREWSAGVVTRF